MDQRNREGRHLTLAAHVLLVILADCHVSVRGNPIARRRISLAAQMYIRAGHNCVGDFFSRLPEPIMSLCNSAPALLHLSHNLEEPRPRGAEGNGPAIVGATKGRSLSTFGEKTRNASLSFPSQRV